LVDQVYQKFSAEAFFRELCGGKVPTDLYRLQQFLKTPAGMDFFSLLNAIGAMEPLSYTRPGATEPKQIYDKTVTVPPATFGTPNEGGANEDGIIPSDGCLIKICAPEGKVLVVDKLRLLPADLTAVGFGTIVYKRLAVVGFSEGFCKAGEPADGDDEGTFQNTEHLILPGKSGFDLYGRNSNPYSPASFTVHAEMWESC
jgi:hypothetical protein